MAKGWRVLVLSRYERLGASTRQRVLQYLPFLERAGAQVVVSSFFDDRYLSHLYSTQRRRLADVVGAYLRRAHAVLQARHFSLIWLQKELFPYLPASIEGLLSRIGVPYAVDYDDAVFHTYDQHRSPLARRILGGKFSKVLASAQLVTVGNSYLEDYVRTHGARAVEMVPTVVDTLSYDAAAEPSTTEFRIGWIGSPATSKYLFLVREALTALSASRKIRLVTIGAPTLRDYGVPLEQHEWSESTEAQLLGGIHVGIMPLPDDPWERGKCGYKLIQYMACGRPVVASPVGASKDIVTQEVGYLAQWTEDWVQALRVLADDAPRRRFCGSAARALVERKYSLERTAPRVVQLLREASCRGCPD